LWGIPPGDLGLDVADFVFGPLTCDYLNNNGDYSGVLVTLHIFERDPATPVGIGTYPIVPQDQADGGMAILVLGPTFGNGAIDSDLVGSSGEVTLTRVDRGSTVHGTFTAEMQIVWDGGDYGTLTGEFDAMWCGPVY
jgi:hypothetical protein